MTPKKLSLIFLTFAFILLILSGVFIVFEGENALILKSGEVVLNNEGKPKVFSAGIYLKWPVINKIKKLDMRLQMLDAESKQALTSDQKNILFDYYVTWKISNSQQLDYYKNTNGGNKAEAGYLLKQKINEVLTSEFNLHTLADIISNHYEPILAKAKEQLQKNIGNSLGIVISDIRLDKIYFPKEIEQSIFSKMKEEREKVAKVYLENGETSAKVIYSNMNLMAKVMIARARSQAQGIKALGDQAASEIYAKAYSQDPAFYNFYRSLMAYKNVFNNKKTIFVLKPDTHFFKHFVGS